MRVKLSEICDVRDGTHDSPNYILEGYPLVTSKNIVNGTLDLSSVNYITKYDYDKINIRSKVDIGDIIMPMIGTIGNPYIVSDFNEFAIKNVALIKFPNKNVNNKYIYFFLNSNAFKRYINESNKGGTQKFLSLKDIRNMPIFLPSFEEQVNVVNKLDSIYSIINKRQQQLDKLDELVKARFVEMFGDKTKYKVEPLSDNVEEMFIGPFGSALKNEIFVEEDHSYCMVYEQKHAIKKTMDLPTRYVDEKKYNELKRFTVLGGDIIVSCRGTIGEIYSIPADAPMGIMHPSIMKIRLKKDKYCNLFFVMMLEQYMQDSINKAKGSGVKMAVTATELGKEMFVAPDIKEQQAFEDFVKQINKSKVAVQKALDEAQLLFDSLMQEYFG